MLKFLSIQNIVLIDSAEIEFSDNGLYIFSGETGSGKSLLLNAIGLVMGKRSNSRLIGDSCDKATVTACFDISNSAIVTNLIAEHQLTDPENKNQINIRRVIQKNSNNRVFINDHPISSQLHQEIGQALIEIHGQFDTSGLLNQSNHRTILDSFAKNDKLLFDLSNNYLEIKSLESKIQEIEEKRTQYIREKDYLEFIINELEEANISINEEQDLIDAKNKIKNQDLISCKLEALKNSCNVISNESYSANNQAIKSIEAFDRSHMSTSELNKISNNLDQISQLVDEMMDPIENTIHSLDCSDLDLSSIEERLFQIKNLSRKFDVNSDGLSKILEESKQKLDAITNKNSITNDLSTKIDKLKVEYFKTAEKIAKNRINSAKHLSSKVENELKYLKMGSVKFHIQIDNFTNDEINEHGLQKVSFLASINNNNFDQITKIASGGELSRFMLALKISLMEVKSVPTIIFDEIDTGISGVTSDAVGNRLCKLGNEQQVLVVTHQPQIAAKSLTHFCIEKNSKGNKIKTTIEKLENNCKFKEVARMISGEKITEESLAAAKKLFNA